MNHNEAVEQMVVERYLLGDLDTGTRDDFEEHLFSCPECALDTRVATAFIEEAKAQLGELAPAQPKVKEAGKPEKGRGFWFLAWRPAFAAPVFAALAVVIGYQNLVTIPTLSKAVGQPQIVPIAPISGAARGGTHPSVAADRAHGISLPVDIPLDPALGTFVSYSFAIHDPQGKQAWSAQGSTGDFELSLVIPGGILKDGAYSVSISGVGVHGEVTPIEEYAFNVTATQ
jgi:anti-sigma factor RsiW